MITEPLDEKVKFWRKTSLFVYQVCCIRICALCKNTRELHVFRHIEHTLRVLTHVLVGLANEQFWQMSSDISMTGCDLL